MRTIRKTDPPKNTKQEDTYIRSLEERSTFDMLDSGEAEQLLPTDYPEPLKRFLRRERDMVHVKLSTTLKRRLEAQSRELGVSSDELAKQWILQHLKRRTG